MAHSSTPVGFGRKMPPQRSATTWTGGDGSPENATSSRTFPGVTPPLPSPVALLPIRICNEGSVNGVGSRTPVRRYVPEGSAYARTTEAFPTRTPCGWCAARHVFASPAHRSGSDRLRFATFVSWNSIENLASVGSVGAVVAPPQALLVTRVTNNVQMKRQAFRM